ncbi:MAG: antitoxin VapB family protein [Methanoregula sp.]
MKTITIREDTYLALKRFKDNNDSFSDVIDRLVLKKGDIREYAGALRDSPFIDELGTISRDMRSSGRARV